MRETRVRKAHEEELGDLARQKSTWDSAETKSTRCGSKKREASVSDAEIGQVVCACVLSSGQRPSCFELQIGSGHGFAPALSHDPSRSDGALPGVAPASPSRSGFQGRRPRPASPFVFVAGRSVNTKNHLGAMLKAYRAKQQVSSGMSDIAVSGVNLPPLPPRLGSAAHLLDDRSEERWSR